MPGYSFYTSAVETSTAEANSHAAAYVIPDNLSTLAPGERPARECAKNALAADAIIKFWWADSIRK